MLEFSLQRKRGTSLFDKGVYPDSFNDQFKSDIRIRDKNRCAICGHKKKPKEHELDVHHINFRKDTDRRNCIALCRKCHRCVHKNFWQRSYWWGRLHALVLHREKVRPLSLEQKREVVLDMRKTIKEME